MPTETGHFIQRGDGGPPVPVLRIKWGEKITAPGIYDVPMAWYHDDCCEGPSISSSGIRRIQKYSPAHYWDRSPLNPANKDPEDRIDPDDDTEALRIGRAAHTLLLEPHTYRDLFATRPAHWDSWRTKDSQKWRAEHQAEGYTVMAPHEVQRVNGVKAALQRHPLYEQGLLDGDIERSIIWKDAKSGIWLKSRPDVIPRGSNIFADLKVVNDARSRQLSKKVFDLGYDMQMGLAGIGMWELLRRAIDEYTLVAVESDRPHAIRIAPIDHADIRWGMSLLRAGITKFAQCLAANSWPSFEEEDNSYVRRSDFESKQIAEAIERGEIPEEF